MPTLLLLAAMMERHAIAANLARVAAKIVRVVRFISASTIVPATFYGKIPGKTYSLDDDHLSRVLARLRRRRSGAAIVFHGSDRPRARDIVGVITKRAIADTVIDSFDD
jgi:hypothetical protein